jgi:hypothetical protein
MKAHALLGIAIVIALYLATTAVAQAPRVVQMRVNESIVLKGANMRCFAKQANLLTCTGSNSRIFVQFSRHEVNVFRAVGTSAVFKLLYRVRR